MPSIKSDAVCVYCCGNQLQTGNSGDIIGLNPEQAIKAFKKMVLNRRNPDLDEFELLDIIRNRGLVDTDNFLHSQLY